MTKYKIFFIVNFFIILAFIGFSVLIMLDRDILEGITLPEYQNDFCQTFTPSSPTDALSLICQNKFKKKKFIWIFIDGLAYDELFEMHNAKLPNLFRIKSKEYKQSGSLHDSIITGKFSRNYPAKAVHIDHIFNQARIANKTMHFLGQRFPLFYLLGQEDNKVLDTFKIISSESRAVSRLCEHLTVKLSDNYDDVVKKGKVDITNHLFDNYTRQHIYDEMNEHYSPNVKLMSSKFNNCLYSLSGDNYQYKSIIFYTMRIDHLNHSYDKKHFTTIIDVYGIEKILTNLFAWADTNDDYAVIVSSDHGGQPFNGEDNICNHGCDKEGNEAILIIYTKEIGGVNYDKYKVGSNKIWIYDVAPTVAQIISDVNIPLEAQGVPREIADDNTLRYTSMKSKEIQLKYYIKHLLSKYPSMKKTLDKYDQLLQHNEYNERLITLDDVEQYANREMYNKYISYLENLQYDITTEIAKSKNSIWFLLIYYIIELCLIIAIYYQCKQIYVIINDNNSHNIIDNSILMFCLILSLLFIEVFICYVFKSQPLYKMLNISRILSFVFIAIVCVVFIFKYNQINKRHISLIIISCIFALISFVMLYTELFINMKIYFNTYAKSITFNFCLNYPLAIIYIIYELYQCKNYYFDMKLRFKLLYVLIPLQVIIFILFIIFDINEPFHFHRHTIPRLTYTRCVYAVIFIYGLFSFIPLYKQETFKQVHKSKTMPNIRISMFIFAYYICDETERSIMMITVISMNALLSYNYVKSNDIYWRVICVIGIIMISDTVYIASQNSFTFDISLKVTSKCIGKYADATPILTGVLFGLHKMKYFMLTSTYLLGITQTSKKHFMKRETYLIRMVLNVQMFLIIMLYFYFLKTNMEEHYLQIFIWLMSKCMVSVVFDVCFIIWYNIYNKCKRYTKNNNEIHNDVKILVNAINNTDSITPTVVIELVNKNERE